MRVVQLRLLGHHLPIPEQGSTVSDILTITARRRKSNFTGCDTKLLTRLITSHVIFNPGTLQPSVLPSKT